MKRISIFSLCMFLLMFVGMESTVYAVTSAEKETMIDNVIADKNSEKEDYLLQIENILSNPVLAQRNQTDANAAALQKKDGHRSVEGSGYYGAGSQRISCHG